MQAYWTLVRREVGSAFNSWMGYAVISAVVFLLGVCFVLLVAAIKNAETDQPLTELFYSTYYFWLILLVATPVVTMRTFALEKYSGTFETLMTAPVKDLQVVLAKFTGAMVFYCLMWLPLVACFFLVRSFSNDPTAIGAGSIVSTLIGIFLLGCLYISIGCFASSITRNQIIAAIVSFAFGISLFLLSFLSYTVSGQAGWAAKVLAHVALIEHMRDFTRGVVDTRAIVFYLSVTAFFLYLTWKSVESRRWK